MVTEVLTGIVTTLGIIGMILMVWCLAYCGYLLVKGFKHHD